MTGLALHSLAHVNIGLRCRSDPVFVVQSAPGSRVAAKAHLVGGFLDSLGSLQDIDPRSGNKPQLIADFGHGPPVIRGMAEQAVDIAIILFRQFADVVGKISKADMTLPATARLRRLGSVLGLENSNPIRLRHRVRGGSERPGLAGQFPLGPAHQELGLGHLLVVQAYGHVFERVGMAGPTGLWSFICADTVGVRRLKCLPQGCSRHSDKEKACQNGGSPMKKLSPHISPLCFRGAEISSRNLTFARFFVYKGYGVARKLGEFYHKSFYSQKGIGHGFHHGPF